MESRINNQITSTSTSVTLDQATANQVIGVLTQTNQELTRTNQELTARLAGVESAKQVLMGEKAVLKNELNILRARLAAENASQSQPMPSVTQRVVVHSKPVATIQVQTLQPASNRQALEREFNEKVALKADTEKFNQLPAKERADVCYRLREFYSAGVVGSIGQDLRKEYELLEELKANDELFNMLSEDRRANVCRRLSVFYRGDIKGSANEMIGKDVYKEYGILKELKSNDSLFNALSYRSRADVCYRLSKFYGHRQAYSVKKVVYKDLAKEKELLEELKSDNRLFSTLHHHVRSGIPKRLAELNSNPVTQTATTQEPSTSTGTKRSSTDDEAEGEKAAEKRARVEASEESASNDAPVVVKQEPLDAEDASAAFGLVDFSGNGSEKGNKDVVDLS